MAEVLVLAADVGGTKTDVALFRGTRPQPVRQRRYHSAEHDGLESVFADFLDDEPVAAAACAAAGPVRDRRIETTNLPWTISAAAMSQRLGGVPVVLLNDLEAAAIGILGLPEEMLRPLKGGTRVDANRAVLAPGTGLGQAILFWDGTRHRPAASEGGHVGFAPRDAQQIELLRFLQSRHPQVSYEHIVSGPGLVSVFEFVTEVLGTAAAPRVRAELAAGRQAAAIGAGATSGECAASRASVELFTRILGARAGDLALSVLARGGLYIGGGMLPKLLPALELAWFEESFLGRGPFRDLLAEIPVHVVLEEHAALLGAAAAAINAAAGRGAAGDS